MIRAFVLCGGEFFGDETDSFEEELTRGNKSDETELIRSRRNVLVAPARSQKASTYSKDPSVKKPNGEIILSFTSSRCGEKYAIKTLALSAIARSITART
jgi:hypothetical protein